MKQAIVIEAIRSIFLQKSLHVSICRAAQLLGLSVAELRIAISTGEIDVITTGIGTRIPRGELIAIALQSWSRALIERALGGDAVRVLPEALRLAELRARIPRYQLLMLKYFAGRDRTSVSEVLARELDGTANVAAEELTANIPDFGAALNWPAKAVSPAA